MQLVRRPAEKIVCSYRNRSPAMERARLGIRPRNTKSSGDSAWHLLPVTRNVAGGSVDGVATPVTDRWFDSCKNGDIRNSPPIYSARGYGHMAVLCFAHSLNVVYSVRHSLDLALGHWKVAASDVLLEPGILNKDGLESSPSHKPW